MSNSPDAEFSVNVEDLNFQDFGDKAGESTHLNSDYFMGDDESQKGGGITSMMSFQYFQPYFDVNQQDVMDRIVLCTKPQSSNALLESISDKPDLYGPFWITSTLIFCISVMGNLASYLISSDWHYDISKLSFSALIMYSYITLVPACMCSYLNYVCKVSVSLLDLVCLFGYINTIYVPMSILCIFPSNAIRWCVVATGFSFSGLILFKNLLPFAQSLHDKRAQAVVAAVGVSHVGLAIIFKFYFFENAAD